ncbi:MAG: type II secretion system major pseudopilin GspG [Proteobacteria bacterium]|nr:type II secretion system major pseudopilin GspG [Pseudomonadota bacterium]
MKGFSLIELLVVLVILGLLGGLVGPRLFNKVDASKVDTAETQVRMLKAAIQTYRLDVGRYPTTEEGLRALVEKPANARIWEGPYLEEVLPLDPWGNDYVYLDTAENFQGFALYSRGADGAEGGEGLDADVGFLP